jgi:hypothetical protein
VIYCGKNGWEEENFRGTEKVRRERKVVEKGERVGPEKERERGDRGRTKQGLEKFVGNKCDRSSRSVTKTQFPGH